MGDSNCILNSMIIGVLISFVMPHVLLYFADPEEVKLPLEMEDKSMKYKLMHLMAHKSTMPLLCAMIVASIVGASVYLGYVIDPMKMLK
tara:strand:+ start:452 stop:718 length:267 start_codon:yes stop_codon:yes gene_type:complete